MGIVDNFLPWFGKRIERRQNDNITTNATTAGITDRFLQDASRQQSESLFFHKGLAPPRQSFLDKQFNDYLRDGAR
jgi:hypothetical protein